MLYRTLSVIALSILCAGLWTLSINAILPLSWYDVAWMMTLTTLIGIVLLSPMGLDTEGN